MRQPVLLRGIRIGTPIDLVLDLAALRVVGLELRCRDEVDRFLPYAVARLEAERILVDSPLQLVEDEDLAFYRRRGTSLRSLQGLPVESATRALGELVDVIVEAGGAVAALVVEQEGVRQEVEVDRTLSIGGRRVAPAA